MTALTPRAGQVAASTSLNTVALGGGTPVTVKNLGPNIVYLSTYTGTGFEYSPLEENGYPLNPGEVVTFPGEDTETGDGYQIAFATKVGTSRLAYLGTRHQ